MNTREGLRQFEPTGELDGMRRDMTASRPFYAIDPPGAAEIDDAVRITPLDDNNAFRIEVAVADGTQIDPSGECFRHALKVGHSVYFDSTDVENQLMLDRDVLRAVSLGGAACRATVLSQVYDYNARKQGELQVQPAWVDVKNVEYSEPDPGYIQMVLDSRRAIHSLERAVFGRKQGAGGFWRHSNSGEKLVATSMAWSNQAMAGWFIKHNVPVMLRVHQPDQPFRAGDGEDARIIHGHYSHRRKGHSAFAGDYAHFTSPLRRAADLVMHQQWATVHTTGQPRYSVGQIKKLARAMTLLQGPGVSDESHIAS